VAHDAVVVVVPRYPDIAIDDPGGSVRCSRTFDLAAASHSQPSCRGPVRIGPA